VGNIEGLRYKGVICDKCGVEVTRSIVRRERMGHINLAVPVSHIWFLRGIPSKMGLILDRSSQELEKVIYFAGYIITKINEDERKQVINEVNKEYKQKIKGKDVKKSDIKEKQVLRQKDTTIREIEVFIFIKYFQKLIIVILV